MKWKTQLALTTVGIAFLAHGYLTLHYYPLKFGLASAASACNINQTFNCDSVATSGFASLFGIPVALWGAITQLVLFYLILLGWLEWSEYPERIRRASTVLAGLTAAASVVMGGISMLFLRSYCVVCIALYLLSFVTFAATRGLLREPFWMHLRRDLGTLWTQSRGIVMAFAMIPAGAFVAHQSFLVNYNGREIEAAVAASVAEWSRARAMTFVAQPMLTLGPAEGAALRIVEFADFRCGHCRVASYPLDAFARSHPDVRLEFYAFPLDGQCNEKINGGDGISCRLAAAVHCAEREGHGWAIHHAIFEAQDEVDRATSLAEIDVVLARLTATEGLGFEQMRACLDDPATSASLKAQAKQGALVDVRGTPTVFANGRSLPRPQLVPVLEAVRAAALSEKR